MNANAPRIEISCAEDLRHWLSANHAKSEPVWLVTWKASTPEKYVSREAVLDELVAFGWVDGRRMKLDDERTMQLIAPRKQQAWAQSYKDRAARLEGEGRMAPSGRASVEEGKASGLWDFYADVDALIVPDDLAAALKALPPASLHFDAFSPSARRNILRWIKIAKTEATRSKRISDVARLASENRKPPQI